VGTGLVIALILCWFVYDKIQQGAEVRAAQIIAQHDKETDAKLDAKLKQLDDRDAERQHDYEAKSAALPKMTPQQIVVKLPEYVPQATQPVTVLKPTDAAVTSGQAHVGDAIVPQQDIQPIAQALLDGKKCSADLVSCKESVGTWEGKYQTKSDEASRWETAAKGGSVWSRMGKTALKVAIGVGIGYAVAKR